MGDLQDEFRTAFLATLQKRKDELGYYAKRVYDQLAENEGNAVKTARWVLGLRGEVSEGLEKLWEASRLDLSVQTLVLEPRFHALFTDEERHQAQETLDYLTKNVPPHR